MSLDVIRILMLTRGKKLFAALIGFGEVSIFILALGQVIAGGLDDPWKVVAYAGGFATGNFVGSILEEKMAIGYLSLQIFPAADYLPDFVRKFREAGFGVTCVTGEGRSGERTILFILLKRKDLKRAMDILNEIDPETFFNITDARRIHGGTFPGKRKGK